MYDEERGFEYVGVVWCVCVYRLSRCAAWWAVCYDAGGGWQWGWSIILEVEDDEEWMIYFAVVNDDDDLSLFTKMVVIKLMWIASSWDHFQLTIDHQEWVLEFTVMFPAQRERRRKE